MPTDDYCPKCRGVHDILKDCQTVPECEQGAHKRSEVHHECCDEVKRLELQNQEQQKKYSDLLQSHHSLCAKIEELQEERKLLNAHIDADQADLERATENLEAANRLNGEFKEECARARIAWRDPKMDGSHVLPVIRLMDKWGKGPIKATDSEKHVCPKCGFWNCQESCVAAKPKATEKRNDEGGDPWAPNKDYPEKPVQKRIDEPRSAIEMHDQRCRCTCSYCTEGGRVHG